MKKIISTIAKKSVETSLKRNANSTTCSFVYQPKAPDSLKKFSKIEK